MAHHAYDVAVDEAANPENHFTQISNQTARQGVLGDPHPVSKQDSAKVATVEFPFPLEIWRLILQFLRAHGQEHMPSAVRIHPTLVEEAESVLYREPEVSSFGQAVKLESAISCALPRRAQIVRELHVFVSWEDEVYAREYRLLMRGLLNRLPHLVTLRWGRAKPPPGMRLKTSSNLTFSLLLEENMQLPIKRLLGTSFLPSTPKFTRFLHAHPGLEEVRFVDHVLGVLLPVSFKDSEFPKLHALGCNHRVAVQIQNAAPNITRLYMKEDYPSRSWISPTQSEMVDDIIRIFGARLISLRVDFISLSTTDLNYPTLRDHRWEDCPRLKFLHIDDAPPRDLKALDRPLPDASDDYKYGLEERKNAKLPPALETFVWAPSWTRYDTLILETHDGYRHAIQRFSEAVLRDITTVREVLYLWGGEDYFHCSLSTTGEWRERRADPREADRDTWAEVR